MHPQNIINHIVLVLDASSSMSGAPARELVKVADNQIAYLAQRSQELDQETRVTVYTFASRVECLIYDKDVLRMPSISQLYRADGMTALIDGTVTALDDLAMTPEKYGEHSFLVYVLTDGMENRSRTQASTLAKKIQALPDHWTIACFVPNMVAVHETKRFGFPAQNIAVWDATTTAGVSEAGEKIRQTTETFMQAREFARSTGTVFRGTRDLFSLKDPSLTDIKSTLKPLRANDFDFFPVDVKCRIDDLVQSYGKRYQVGKAYYQLSKRETIQPQKQIAIASRDGKVYVGDQARQLLGLPNDHVKVDPLGNPDYTVFVQSTSVNRNLMPNTKLLVLA